MAFSALVGQDELKRRLGSILRSEPGHAYVLTGPDGIGKSSFALELAKALLCQAPTEAGACTHCDACRHVDHGVHPDLRSLILEGQDKLIKVERVRQTIQADINLRPQLGLRKIYLIDADHLNEQGQNTLLKSLEEPPNYVTFILMAAGIERLLPTIQSRLTILPLRRYDSSDVLEILRRESDRQGIETPAEATLNFYARYANGIPGAAISLLSSPWFSTLRTETITFYEQLGQLSRAQILTAGYAFLDTNRAQAGVLIDILTSLVRDQLVLATTGLDHHLTNTDLTARLEIRGEDRRQARIPGLLRAAAALSAARRGLALNASFEGLACHLLLTLRKELSYA